MKAVLCLIGFICVQLVSGEVDPDLECTEGSEWSVGCNDCWCDPRGFITCTTKACGNDDRSVGSCKDGSRWLQDNCNWCSCNGGQAVCTLRDCPPGLDREVRSAFADSPLDGSECQGETWMEDCNRCHCRNGRKSCTKRLCPKRPTRSVNNNICFLPKDSGICLADFPSFWYNANTKRCEEFSYGGCGGNANRFDSIRACRKACRQG